MRELFRKISGLCVIFLSIVFLPLVLLNLNWNYGYLAFVFSFCFVLTCISLTLTVFNNWDKLYPELIKLENIDPMPYVVVLIPTCGEYIRLIEKTVVSILSQNYPIDKIIVIIGDDSRRPELRKSIENLSNLFLKSKIIYLEPPLKTDPNRLGSAKDGNLNFMLTYVLENFSYVKFIETRDCDDLVGDENFLRYTIGHLLKNPELSFVQTIKEAITSKGDPFGNMNKIFYRGIMFSRNASNAVFPCGSGLVWRKNSIVELGGFPTWNLVEDLYSGYLALQKGMNGLYIPIVGAVAQISPEDIPNVYKQLGTWAIDTMRIFLWHNPLKVKGLNFKQKLHFLEQGFSYTGSYILFIYMIIPIILLAFNITLFGKDNIYFICLIIYSMFVEIFLLSRSDNVNITEHWRNRQIWIGLIFVFMKAGFYALSYGPNNKPQYIITRKDKQFAFYWKEVLPQLIIIFLILCSITLHLINSNINHSYIDYASIFWSLVWIILLSGIIRRSWYGLEILPIKNLKFKLNFS